MLESFPEAPTIHLQEDSELESHLPALKFLHSTGRVSVVKWKAEEAIHCGETTLRYLRVDDKIPMFAFLLEEGGKRALICADHARSLRHAPELPPLDLLLMNMGTPTDNDELTCIRDNLAIIERTKAKRTVLTHIEESFQITPERKAELEKDLGRFSLSLAEDGERIVLG